MQIFVNLSLCICKETPVISGQPSHNLVKSLSHLAELDILINLNVCLGVVTTYLRYVQRYRNGVLWDQVVIGHKACTLIFDNLLWEFNALEHLTVIKIWKITALGCFFDFLFCFVFFYPGIWELETCRKTCHFRFQNSRENEEQSVYFWRWAATNRTKEKENSEKSPDIGTSRTSVFSN